MFNSSHSSGCAVEAFTPLLEDTHMNVYVVTGTIYGLGAFKSTGGISADACLLDILAMCYWVVFTSGGCLLMSAVSFLALRQQLQTRKAEHQPRRDAAEDSRIKEAWGESHPREEYKLYLQVKLFI